MHILVFHSCGRVEDDRKLSRNLVYTRKDSVAGAKNSENILSTFADVLLCSLESARLQPALYRSGSEKQGNIV